MKSRQVTQLIADMRREMPPEELAAYCRGQAEKLQDTDQETAAIFREAAERLSRFYK